MRRDIGASPNNRFVGQGPCALPWALKKKSPSVMSSPPPLGKGAKEIRIATTSDIGHWFRNDSFFVGVEI